MPRGKLVETVRILTEKSSTTRTVTFKNVRVFNGVPLNLAGVLTGPRGRQPLVSALIIFQVLYFIFSTVKNHHEFNYERD